MCTLLELNNVNLSRGGVRILSNINWRVRAAENWAVLGDNGAGKSTLLRLALGEVRPDQNFDATAQPGELAWYIGGVKETSPIAARQVVAGVSPELHDWYARHGWQLSGEELLLSGLYASPLIYNTPLPDELAEVRALAAELELEHLLNYTVAEMSQGQLRRMLVARALIIRPLLLALDEVFEGLDAPSRARLSDLLAYCKTTILMTAHREEDLPDFIRCALILEQGRIVRQGLRPEFRLSEADLPDSRRAEDRSALASAAAPLSFKPPELQTQTESSADPADFAQAADLTLPLLELKQVNVFLERKHVLHDINWTVQKGENWAVLGENGSGKTTLLRCLWGEVHPALGGVLAWFGNPGPHNQALLHRQFGLVSHRLQTAVPPDMPVADLVVSGFFASLDLYQPPSAARQQAALELLEKIGLAHLAERRAGTLSYGQLRRVLLARALVHKPVLLFLDEPCSGLDAASRAAFLLTLAEAAQNGSTQLIHVTHHETDLVGITSHVLCLEQGKIVYSGTYPHKL